MVISFSLLYPYQHPDVDIEHLFGNIEEVADVSQRLLTKMEEALNGKDFDQQVIGELQWTSLKSALIPCSHIFHQNMGAVLMIRLGIVKLSFPLVSKNRF